MDWGDIMRYTGIAVAERLSTAWALHVIEKHAMTVRHSINVETAGQTRQVTLTVTHHYPSLFRAFRTEYSLQIGALNQVCT